MARVLAHAKDEGYDWRVDCQAETPYERLRVEPQFNNENTHGRVEANALALRRCESLERTVHEHVGTA